MMQIEVVYATEKYVDIIPLSIEEGATVDRAIKQSGIMISHPEIDLSENKVGIYSKLCSLDTLLADGDRIEIYRPLKADPKDARRVRAERQKAV